MEFSDGNFEIGKFTNNLRDFNPDEDWSIQWKRQQSFPISKRSSI